MTLEEALKHAENIHMDYGVADNCKNLMESYGEICVKCNKCGRFDNSAEQQGENT